MIEQRQKRVKWFSLIFAVAVVAAVLVYLRLHPIGGKEAPPAEKLTMGIAGNVVSCLAYIAEAKGFYTANGLDVSLKVYPAGLIAFDEMMRDRVDVSTCADIVFVIRGSGENLKIFATIARAEDHRIIVRADRGITEPQDLKGTRIAVTLNTSSHFFLETFLSFNEIPLESVYIKDLPPKEMLNAIMSGAVDAVCTWEPYAGQIIDRLGPRTLRWPAQSGRNYNWVLIAKDEFLDKKRPIVNKLLRAMLDAEAYVRLNPVETRAILAQRMNIGTARLAATWDRYDFRVRLDQDLLILMEDEARWAIRRGIVSFQTIPDYSLPIDLESLGKIKPEAIGIIH